MLDICIKIIYNLVNKEIIVEKNYLGLGYIFLFLLLFVYFYFKGFVERFDVVFIFVDKIEIEYDVVIKRRVYGVVK